MDRVRCTINRLTERLPTACLPPLGVSSRGRGRIVDIVSACSVYSGSVMALAVDRLTRLPTLDRTRRNLHPFGMMLNHDHTGLKLLGVSG
jgi:hypothetical protein